MVLFKRYDRQKSEILPAIFASRHLGLEQSVTPIRMNGDARTLYSTLSRVYDFFYPIVYDFVLSLLTMMY